MLVSWFCSLHDQIFRPSKLPANADFHCFKAGIEPKWEDPECANGGKWSVTCNRKSTLDTMWLETVRPVIFLFTTFCFLYVVYVYNELFILNPVLVV